MFEMTLSVVPDEDMTLSAMVQCLPPGQVDYVKAKKDEEQYMVSIFGWMMISTGDTQMSLFSSSYWFLLEILVVHVFF